MLVALGVAVLGAAGCSTPQAAAPEPTVAATPSSPAPTRPDEPAAPVLHGLPEDLAAVQAAGDAVERSGSAAYVYEQTIKLPGENSVPLVTRSGTLDFGRGLHEVQIDFSDPTADDGVVQSLTLLSSPGRVLVDAASYSEKTGKRWTLLPADQLAALSHGAALATALPGAEVLRHAEGALPRVRSPEGSSYAVYVREYDALPLLSATAAEQLQQRTGAGIAELQQEYDAVLELAVELDGKGRLASLYADLTSMTEHYAQSLGDRADPGGQFTLQESVSDIGLPQDVDEPSLEDIAAAPPSS